MKDKYIVDNSRARRIELYGKHMANKQDEFEEWLKRECGYFPHKP